MKSSSACSHTVIHKSTWKTVATTGLNWSAEFEITMSRCFPGTWHKRQLKKTRTKRKKKKQKPHSPINNRKKTKARDVCRVHTTEVLCLEHLHKLCVAISYCSCGESLRSSGLPDQCLLLGLQAPTTHPGCPLELKPTLQQRGPLAAANSPMVYEPGLAILPSSWSRIAPHHPPFIFRSLLSHSLSFTPYWFPWPKWLSENCYKALTSCL